MSTRASVIALLVSALLPACSNEERQGATSPARLPVVSDVSGQTEVPAQVPGPIAEASLEPATTPVQPDEVAAIGADSCDGVDIQLTDARRHDYARLVGAAMNGKVRPGNVDISTFMEDGAWSMVLASTPIADPGYFFFEDVDGRKRFRDVWAGVAESDEVPGVIEWAKGLGMPDTFANCFVTAISVVE